MSRFQKRSTPKLTAELIEALSLAIRRGAYVETAVALCGISKDTFYRWLHLADEEDPSSPVRKLSDAVKKALAESEMRDLDVIDRAAQNGEWTAAAWRLERKFPHKWGRQARLQVEHSGPDGADISMTCGIDLTKLSTEELLLLEKAVKRNEKSSKKSEDPSARA